MDPSILLFSILTILLPTSDSKPTSKCKPQIYDNKYHTENSLLSRPIKTKSIQECINSCKKKKGCKSVNLFKRECTLHGPGFMPNRPQFKYGSIHAVVDCSANISPPKPIDDSPEDESDESQYVPPPAKRPPPGGKAKPGKKTKRPASDKPDEKKPEKEESPKPEENCGKQGDGYSPNLLTPFIIGGGLAKAHSWPWMIHLFIDFGGGKGAGCGASLIRVNDNVEKSDIILTAAHCVTKAETAATKPKAFRPEQFRVSAGKHDERKIENGQEVRVGVEVRFHTGYRFDSQEGAINDIALIKLDRPIEFTDTIRPGCLPPKGAPSPVDKLCFAAGWGRIASGNHDTSPILKQVKAPAQTDEVCEKAYPSLGGTQFRKEEQICAGSMNGDSGVCNGDSGGMLACKEKGGSYWTLYGATSYGPGEKCLEVNTPAVFVRISGYLDWIWENMKMSALIV